MSKPEKMMKKAAKATIYLGSIPINVYQMPDSSYKLYWESITSVVDQPNDDLLNTIDIPQIKYVLPETICSKSRLGSAQRNPTISVWN